MAKVYFRPVDSYTKTEEISRAARELLQNLVQEENISLGKTIPLKVHFGEKGNKTFIEPKNYEGIISYLKEQEVEGSFIETNVLYRGERTTKDDHIAIAKEHGFIQLPITIADGDKGEEYEQVKINKKHFKVCKIGKAFAQYNQMIVLSHFKGHILAGFGGAIKQIAMGGAARPGKLDQHSRSQPFVIPFKCKKCKTCVRHCPVDAIRIGFLPRIDRNKCIGCACCIAVCPFGAIVVNFLASFSKSFTEKLVEYAYALNQGKKNIFLNFAFNITRFCDCEGRPMKPIAGDLGVFASTDPVAIDKACLDELHKKEGRKVFRRGYHTLDYSQDIGLGSKEYELVKM